MTDTELEKNIGDLLDGAMERSRKKQLLIEAGLLLLVVLLILVVN